MMFEWTKRYPMVVLLLPLVAAILLWKYSEFRHQQSETNFKEYIRKERKEQWKREKREKKEQEAQWKREKDEAGEFQDLMQERLYGRLRSAGLEGDELATIGALTLGYKKDLDKELRRHFQASGAAHVLAVSGLHTGIIYGLLVWLLTLGGRYKPLHEEKWKRRGLSVLIIAVMWGYAWLTGMTPSVVRAVLMVTIFEIGRMVYRQAFSLNTVAAAAVIILMVHPQDLWSVSFQLSFAATAAIVVLMRSGLRQTIPLRDVLLKRSVLYILGMIGVSLAAQLGTLPITMYYFGQISNYFLLTNLIVLPIATFLVPLGLATLALGGSWLGIYAGKATWALAWATNHSVEWIEHLPGSTTKVSISLGMVAVYYVFFVLFCYFFTKKD